ncbi:hypothetical protein AVEN_17775-1 [Araneus ventricosus]|uniref:Uncharacterized protein n=1 Tax=Araneus ventricosus TaxID=182803 RepID=A0A4Y2SLE9_ARAVE|nr:hypothetical protein AVEN_155537-1 [Araneus ventricosus]GBN89092.1 hypothetical protein AVEN_17775-1 [Araneus ventricosus]
MGHPALCGGQPSLLRTLKKKWTSSHWNTGLVSLSFFRSRGHRIDRDIFYRNFTPVFVDECTSSQLSQSPSQIFISKAVDGHHSAFLTGRAIIFPKSKREHRIVEKTRIQHRGHFFQVQQGTGLLRRRASNTVVISSKSNRAQDYRERRASKRMSQDLHQTLSLHPTVCSIKRNLHFSPLRFSFISNDFGKLN